MATHSSILAWRIPGTEEPGWLPSMGSHRVRQDWCVLAASAAAINSFLCILEGGSFIIWKFTLDKICFKICPCYLFLHFTSNTVIYHLVSIYWIYFKHCSSCKNFFFLRYTINVLMKFMIQWSEKILSMYSNKYTRQIQVMKMLFKKKQK